MTTTVYLVDDHAMFRAGVRAELGTRLTVVGEAGTPAEAIAGKQDVLRGHGRSMAARKHLFNGARDTSGDHCSLTR